ncbi:MAG: HD domain-containing protein [Anaerolineae bacterium]|nr:HD domain-containing protein [Anaerolineae bacterium]MCB0252978.1 HD domain-containing protein [Anaerolineae bacterium]
MTMITIDEARALYSGADAAHSFDHILRVLALAEHIAVAEGADLEIVRTATLLHDIARLEPDHQRLGAERAREILAGQPAERVEAVSHAIEAHRFRKGPAPATLEACCLFDADKLDAIGAVGVARAVAYGAVHGQRIWSQPLDAIDASQPPPGGDGYTPSHEFVYKLARLADMLTTPTARRIAADRHRVMVEFFRRLDLEVAGEA